MSTNLHLSASREVYTKSGKNYTQTKSIDLLQTPSEITYKILEFPTFEGQLDAYCRWSEQREAEWTKDEEYQNWMEIYDSEIRSKESYMTFDIDIQRRTALGYYSDVYDDLTILRVVLKGEPEFDKILSQKDIDMAFIYHNEAQNHIGVGYRLVVDTTYNSTSLRKKIQVMREEDYELEFFAM